MKKNLWLAALAALLSTSTLPADEPAAINPVNCDACCSSPSQGGIFAEIGFWIMTPRWESNPAYGVSVSNGITVAEIQQDFDYGADFVPRITVGYACASGLGARANFWTYSDNASADIAIGTNQFGLSATPLATRITAEPGELLETHSSLDLDVFDIEAISMSEICNLHLLISGGIRFADLTQTYGAHSGGVGAGPNPEDLRSSYNFRGAGLTAAAEARYDTGSGLAPYANVRGSILFGTGKQDISRIEFAGGAAEEIVLGHLSSDDTIPVGELELGLAYGTNLSGMNAWARVGVMAQTWFNAGNSSLTESIFVSSADSNTNLSFLGLSVMAGLKY